MSAIKAAFKIVVNANDITPIIADRFIGLDTNDSAGIRSDTVTIELDNREQLIALPPQGAEMEVWLGEYVNGAPSLELEGLYIIDEIATSDRAGTMTIHGKAADMLNGLKAPRDQSYDEITLSDLVSIIANRHGYEPMINSDVMDKIWPHIDQVGQSDIDLLTQKASEIGAICKPTGKRLCLLPEDGNKTASGTAFPVINLDASVEGVYVEATIRGRSQYLSVKAHWQDMDDTNKQSVTAGEGEPMWVMTEVFQTQELAEDAAASKLAQLQRGKTELTIEMDGDVRYKAERTINLFNHIHAGTYVIKESSKSIGKGRVFTNSLVLTEPRPVY